MNVHRIICTPQEQYNTIFRTKRRGRGREGVLWKEGLEIVWKAIFTLVTDLQPLAFLNRVKGEITFHDNEQVLLELGRVNQVSTCFGYIPAKRLKHV